VPFGSIVDFVPCCIAYATSLYKALLCKLDARSGDRNSQSECLYCIEHVTSPYKDLSGHIHIFLHIFMSPVNGLVM
jgi:hypothetical protein